MYNYKPEFFNLVDVLHSCSLQRLSLHSNRINDEDISYLGRALVNNKTTLKYLNLCESDGITTGGWREFSNCLRSPNCVLEELNIRHCYIDDDSAAVIISALTGNSHLKQLYMLSDTGGIEFTGTVWRVLDRVLCDTTSIDSIAFSSNHTIHTIDICSEDEGAPDHIVSLLEMNNNASNAESSRRKILTHWFFEGKFTLELALLPNNVLPFGLEWVGRDRFGYSTMHNVMRRLSRDLVVESESTIDMDYETMDD